MSRAKIKALINKLKGQMQERKPFESIPHNMGTDGGKDLPSSMTGNGLGSITSDLANSTASRVTSSLPAECRGSASADIIAKEAVEQVQHFPTFSNVVVNAAQKALSKAGSKVTTKLENLINNSTLADISKALSERPDQIIYNKLLADASAMFLSDNPNDYIAAMLGMTQESVSADTVSILSEIDDIKAALESYVSSLRQQVEHLAEVRTFPNLIQVLINMQKDMAAALSETASLQGRIAKEGNYSEARLDSVTGHINNVLVNNSRIQQALGIYDPNAHMNCDIKGFADYLKKRVENLIKKVKNIGDFKSKFQADINPMDIFYKNFSRLYKYLCEASKRVGENTTKWKDSNINVLKENCSAIEDNLYKSLVIFDQYRRSNTVGVTDVDNGGTVVGRVLNNLLHITKTFDTAPLLASLNELLYVIEALSVQGLSLINSPFEIFKSEALDRGIPDNILSLLNFDGIRNGEWSNVLDFDKYLKLDLKSEAMSRLVQKCENIGIPLNKLPKLDVINSLSSRLTNGCNDLKRELTSMNNVVNNPEQQPLKSVVPPKVAETIKDMSAMSPSIKNSFKSADVAKFSSSLSSPESTTEEGAAAADLKNNLKEIEADDSSDMTLEEKDAINRTITLLTSDHIQQCTEALIKSEGFGDKLTFQISIDEYVTEVYDNVNEVIDWLSQLYDATYDDVGTSSGSQSMEFDFKSDLLTQKGSI